MQQPHSGAPQKTHSPQGLYHPRFEHEACGIGFVAHVKGRKSHEIVQQALTVLQNMDHRGARGSEKDTGDGAGILLQLPHAFLQQACREIQVKLPQPGDYGAGMLHLPRDPAPRQRCQEQFAAIVHEEGQKLLACADQLNRVGHSVTVFERHNRPGGLLMYGIPNMKLEKDLVQRRLHLMAAAGVTFVTGVEVGSDISAARLLAQHDAVVLCTGATRPRDLNVPGRELDGIHFAVDFLRANTKSLLDGNRRVGNDISARNRDVIVIGGGDTGTDCVATALRHDCRSLVQFEILPRPPAERAPGNPWPQWPNVYRLDYGQEEAAARFGGDPRRYCVMTRAFLGDDRGRLRGIKTVEVTWLSDNKGRRQLREVPGTERTWPAQRVLLAMGFLGPEAPLLQALGVERDERSNVAAEHGTYTTNVPGVFAAGDARRGQSLIVWAINEGRGAARAVDAYLMGETDLP